MQANLLWRGKRGLYLYSLQCLQERETDLSLLSWNLSKSDPEGITGSLFPKWFAQTIIFENIVRNKLAVNTYMCRNMRELWKIIFQHHVSKHYQLSIPVLIFNQSFNLSIAI